jgi:hypothetical protein
MCECAGDKATNPMTAAPPGEPASIRCPVAIGTLPSGAPYTCPTTIQGGFHGLHRHHLTVHPLAHWTPRPGHP